MVTEGFNCDKQLPSCSSIILTKFWPSIVNAESWQAFETPPGTSYTRFHNECTHYHKFTLTILVISSLLTILAISSLSTVNVIWQLWLTLSTFQLCYTSSHRHSHVTIHYDHDLLEMGSRQISMTQGLVTKVYHQEDYVKHVDWCQCGV